MLARRRNSFQTPGPTPFVSFVSWSRTHSCNTVLLISSPAGRARRFARAVGKFQSNIKHKRRCPAATSLEICMQRKLMAALVAAALTGIGASAGAATGPSSSQSPYLVPQAAGIEFTSILTVGDEIKKKHKGNEKYRMVGIPDGLGAYDN